MRLSSRMLIWSIILILPLMYFLDCERANAKVATTKVSGDGYLFPETPKALASFGMDIHQYAGEAPSGQLQYNYTKGGIIFTSTAEVV